ncbi:TIGR03557 family F420-dependent LLM class oxidoreductase [Microcella daejeonensis]|uniref:TIGR03557 family F420-dependent LLM class oxidoreductase n=1 Tax=Microcella daejeonensis TaxID=2994971 RepID=UPI00226E27C8|nr:TIGR03557 family F420-dependent LLM class oxidoreductase [Microcella daejeonensis]WAB85346.1 TIGR03557 family F420-dependent LLM class oxidoreductase [Microcella daejeonensis]
MRVGATLMTEQSPVRSLVDYAVAAEAAGAELLVTSDHFSPWLAEQGHAPQAWTLLGAVAQATSRVDLMTYVTCPTMRYHPSVVAQFAATLQDLSGGRFTLGLGSGENLNEHAAGVPWPRVATRHAMLEEAVRIIRTLLDGDTVSFHGEHFSVDAARLWGTPEHRVPIGLAISGEKSIEALAPLGDDLVAVQPDGDAVERWTATAGAPRRVVGQLPICWDPDRDRAIARAHEQFRWFGGGWLVNADLPTPASFAAATRFVRPEDVAEAIACGPDLDAIARSAQPFVDAGFTDLALVQIGDEGQQRFLDEVAEELFDRIRALTPGGGAA